jgi:hypothetical protein
VSVTLLFCLFCYINKYLTGRKSTSRLPPMFVLLQPIDFYSTLVSIYFPVLFIIESSTFRSRHVVILHSPHNVLFTHVPVSHDTPDGHAFGHRKDVQVPLRFVTLPEMDPPGPYGTGKDASLSPTVFVLFQPRFSQR